MAFTPPILFIFGPSGVGKSTFGNYLAQTHGWLHLEMDQFPNPRNVARVFDILQLQHEWDLFCLQNPLPLVRALRQRVASANKTNCVLTFSSGLVVTPELIKVFAPSTQICYLYGSAAHCINAYLRRELETGRGWDGNTWIQHNHDSYTKMSLPSYEPYRVHVFTRDGHHRSHADILVEVSKANMHN